MQSYQQEGTVRVKIIFPIQHLIWQWYMDNRPGGVFPGDCLMRVTRMKLAEKQMNSMSTSFVAGKLFDK